MSAKLIILGLLREGPMHGYEIKRRIEHEAMAEWTDISYGAIYFALNKLAEENFVEKVSTEQVGKRPSRDVYQITESGQAEFFRLLRHALSTVERKGDPVDIGIRFMSALPRQEAQALLNRRKGMLEQILQALSEEKAGFVERHHGEPYVEGGCALFDHGLVQLKAELEWLQGVLDKLEQGLLLLGVFACLGVTLATLTFRKMGVQNGT
jgi:DNA-binding PadR family transcriptional regulator